MDMDKNFTLRIEKDYQVDVYLSCSWQPDTGLDASYVVVENFDANSIRVIGDVLDEKEQDPNRITRIMKDCSGFFVVLPFRSNHETNTSPWIIEEIEIAAKLDIPFGIAADYRLNVKIENDNEINKLILINDNNTYTKEIILKNSYIENLIKFESGNGDLKKQLSHKLYTFIDKVSNYQNKNQPYVFLITRLEKDFKQAREMIKASVENIAGIPCLWADDSRHETNCSDVTEAARLLIKNATFVVGDITLDQLEPSRENPSRSHEIGISTAYCKDIILCSQDPRRYPYHSIYKIQIIFWNNEDELYNNLKQWLISHKSRYCRSIYNYRLPEKNNKYDPKIKEIKIDYNKDQRYISPNLYKMKGVERGIIAISFGLIVFVVPSLVKKYLKYDDTLDLAPILAAVFTAIFSSDLRTSIIQSIAKVKYLRFLIPFIAVGFLIIWFFM